ncbi:ATP-dependent DNA helicase RecG [Devriesea agamarum]|uniref:ATP-dependent DNA helicase RecG n=1 Tax=Devriesea agamarum TaxID=472569 RepID=UPI00071D6ACF|nr:ATP-dependent DNA helicase RecG [Devriesea agamarum]
MRAHQTQGSGRSLSALLTQAQLKAIRSLGADDIDSALRILPRRYEVPGDIASLDRLAPGESATVLVTVEDVTVRAMARRRGSLLNARVSDGSRSLALTFFVHNPGLLAFHERRLTPGRRVVVSGTIGVHQGALQIVHPDYEVLDHDNPDLMRTVLAPKPVYPLRAEIKQITMRRAYERLMDYVGTLPPGGLVDPVPTEVVKRQGLLELPDALRMVHAPRDLADARLGRRRLAFEEAFILQTIFALRRLEDGQQPASPLASHDPLTRRVRERLPFTLTAGQHTVLDEISGRLKRPHPSNILLQGDVGSGKTILALLAMLQAVDSGTQAALLAPTEVLAEQHYRTISQFLGDLGTAGTIHADPEATRIHLLTGSTRAPARRAALADLASGQPALVVGTHALLSDTVQLPTLGLVVIDEQHRFGVHQRSRLRFTRDDGVRPHVLVMSATPIPRTAALTLFGDLDVLTLTETPAQRSGVTSYVVHESDHRWMDRMWQRADEEIAAGRQVFVVCPRIDDRAEGESETLNLRDEADGVDDGAGIHTVNDTYRLLSSHPALQTRRLAALHGRMDTADKQRVMDDFVAHRVDLVVATTVVEVGVDVPRASTMIVLDAERFGVSQLHQLRGRVGRGEAPGIAFFVTNTPHGSPASDHLQQLAATTDGFALARYDLSERREGNLVGTAQSGRSALRLVDVLEDSDLVFSARQEAERIVDVEPSLANYPSLHHAVTALTAADGGHVERT